MRILGAFQTIVGLSALLSVVGARVVEAQGVTFALTSSTNQPGATVTASVTVSGFDDVGGAQFSLQWDPTVLSYVGLANYGLNYLAAGNFGTAPALTTNGELSCSWDDQSGSTTGTTVPDGTVMFTISFAVIGSAGTASSLALVDVPTARQVFSAALAPLDFISVDGQVQVRSRPEISAWPTASSITYGQALAASALSGGVASVAGSFAFDTPETTPGVGAYGASVTFTPADTVDYPSVTNTVLVNVDPAQLTITAGAQTKTYGQALNLGTTAFTTTGLLNGDAVTAVALTSPGAAATAAVAGSPYAIAASAAVGTGLANYNISYQPGLLTVTPAPLSVTGNNATRLYGAANPPFTGTIAGLQNGDLISATFVALTDPTSPVGDYTITASLSGVASTLDNYTLNITLGTLTVLPATPGVTWANPAPITYGAALSTVQLNATPSVPGTVVYTPPAGTVLPAGTNSLSLAFSPTDATDYSNLAASVTLLVLPAPLTMTANNATRPYGAANPPFTGTITGIQNNDNITATYTCSAGPTTAPGAYPIVPAPVSPGNLQTNYEVTLVDGTLTVFPANPPAVVVQPANQVVGLGQSAMFAVGVTGTGPLSYQWQLNGASLADSGRVAGSQSNLLALAGLLLSDAGNYQAVITNAYGSVTSAVATLTVIVPPLLQAVAQSNGTVTFSWSATPGQSYQVQYASDLTQPNWTNLVIITATNSTATASDAVGSSAQRFYRTIWSP